MSRRRWRVSSSPVLTEVDVRLVGALVLPEEYWF